MSLILAVSFLAACSPAGGEPAVAAPLPEPSSSPKPPSSASASAAPAASAATPEPTPPGPEWSLHGKRVGLKSALIKSYGGQMRELFLSTGPLSCDQIKAHGVVLSDRKQRLMTLRISPPMKGKSASVVQVSYPTSDNNIMTTTLKDQVLKVPPAAQGVVSMPIELNLKEAATDSRPEQSVVFKGPVELKDCGVFPASSDGEALPQPGLKVEVNGESVEIKGALLLPDDKEPRLILTSEPNGCQRDSFADVGIELRYKGNSSSLGSAILLGNRVDNTYQTASEKDLKKLRTRLPAKLPKAGSKVEIPLDGELGLPSEMKLKFSGKLSALVCKLSQGYRRSSRAASTRRQDFCGCSP